MSLQGELQPTIAYNGVASCRSMNPVIDRLDELPPLPRRTPNPRRPEGYLLLLANAVIGNSGLFATARADREQAQLQEALDTLRAENRRLHRHVEALTSDRHLLEDVARRELGMIRPGERLFVVRSRPSPVDAQLPNLGPRPLPID